MNLLIKLAFRNIFRNKRRSLITALVMCFGLTGLIFVDGFLNGLVNSMVQAATTTFLGDWQIHPNKSSKLDTIDNIITNIEEIESELKPREHDVTWAKRITSDGMATSAEFSSYVRIYGISVEEELKTSEILNYITEGEKLSSEITTENEILIGAILAENLGLHINEHLVIMSSGYNKIGMIQERFKVVGIFKSGSRRLDQNLILMSKKTAQNFFKIPDQIYHEVAVHSLNEKLRSHPELFQIKFKDNDMKNWKQLIPALDAGINITLFSRLIYSIILLFLILLTVTNTILMSIYERIYEMGVMKAIGTKANSIFKLILYETFFLTLMSCLLGSVLGFICIFIFQKNGIPFGHIEYFGTSISKGIIPLFNTYQFTFYPLYILLCSLVASIYPAIYASRIKILSALRKA